MNPKTQRTILKQSRIFGYSGAILSIPFGFLGGLIASCCPFGVLIGAIPLLVTSGLGAQLAAIFLDYSVVSRRNSTGAGLRVGVRSATISALAGGVIIVLTASQSLSAMTAAAGTGDPEGAGVSAAIILGLINLLFLLVLVGCCALLAIVPGVIGAAIRGSAALDQEPEPEPGWEAELKALKKSSLIEWAVLLGLLAACAIIIPTIQQYSMGKSHPRQQEMAGSGQADYVPPGLFPGVPPVSQTPDQAPFSISQDGKYTVEIFEDSQQGRMILVTERGDHLFEEPALGWLMDVFWSPDGRFLAINERRANSGDYLWILDLQGQKVLKRPDDAVWREMESKAVTVLEARADTKWGEGVQGDRSFGTGTGWLDADTLLAKVAVGFRGTAIAVGESSNLEIEYRIKVNPAGVSLLSEASMVGDVSDRRQSVGQDLLFSGYGLEFIEGTATLVSTFEWYARFGAERETVRLGDLELDSAKVGLRFERGALEGGVPVGIPLKPGRSLKKERWSSGAGDFSWALPPFEILETREKLTLVAQDAEKAPALVTLLRSLRIPPGAGGPSPHKPQPPHQTPPAPGPSVYEGSVGRLAARFELEWHSDRSVTGRYWYPTRNPEMKYVLKGLNPSEGELILVELTNGKDTATLRMRKDSGTDRVTWKGRMSNTDGREFDVVMSRVSEAPVGRSNPGNQPASPEMQSFSKALELVWAGTAVAPKSLEGLSPWELKILRNAIFAQHGRAFKSGKLSGFFHRYPGYTEDPGYSDNRITATDRANAEAIKAAELVARRPSPDSEWNALRGFLDALASGDPDFIASLIHPSKPVERVMFTLDDPPKVAHEKRLPGNSEELKDLWVDDGANGESSSFMMSALWGLTISPLHAGNGLFRNKGSYLEVGVTEISGKWWLTRVADAVP